MVAEGGYPATLKVLLQARGCETAPRVEPAAMTTVSVKREKKSVLDQQGELRREIRQARQGPHRVPPLQACVRVVGR